MNFFEWLIGANKYDAKKEKALTEKRLEAIYSKTDNVFIGSQEEIEKFSKLLNKEKVNKPTTSMVYRPHTFNDYIGQSQAKEYLQRYIDGTKKRKRQFPHTIITGYAGTGKTALAKIIANELNLPFQEVLSARIKDPMELIEVVENIEGGILFLDEVHALDREIVEMLYTLMEDFQFEGRLFKPFTMIGATTEYGEMVENRKPFLDRFKIKITLEDYSKNDISQIVKKYKERTFKDDNISDLVYNKIAENCRFTPRVGISLLDSAVFLNGDIDTTLKSANIIKKGFTNKDLEYLEAIALSPKGIGLNAIASSLMTSKKDVTEQIEPYLFKNKMVISTKTGRIITDAGKALIIELKNNTKQQTMVYSD